MDNLLIRYSYTAFLGVLIVAFVGLGIQTFYPRIEYPEYPTELSEFYRDCGYKEECSFDVLPVDIRLAEDTYADETRTYEQTNANYSRNASIISLGLSIVILAISLIFIMRLGILSDGMLIGGILTLAYGIILGFGSNDAQFRFLTVSVGLVIAIVLGYIRFVKPHTPTNVTTN